MSEKIRGLGRMHFGGKDRPFQVNSIRQTAAFCEQMGIELEDYWSHISELTGGSTLTNVVSTIAFVYSALYAGARKERIIVDFTYEDVLDWFEEVEGEAELLEFYKPLQLFGENIQKEADRLNEILAAPKKV